MLDAVTRHGIIVLSDTWSDRVHRWTAANHDSGWLFILIGAVFVLAATLPLLVSTQTVPAHDAVVTEPEPVANEREPLPAEHEPSTVPEPIAPEDS